MSSVTDKVTRSVISRLGGHSTNLLKRDVNEKQKNDKKVIFHKVK